MPEINHVENRTFMAEALRRELVGPDPVGLELDCDRDLRFAEAAKSYGPWVQMGTGEEILQRDSPVKRYGVGVLYPLKIAEDDVEFDQVAAQSPENVEVSPETDEPSGEFAITANALHAIEDIAARDGVRSSGGDDDDFD